MDYFASVITEIDYLLGSKRKRHLIGGMLISMALLCGGLAVTVGTLKGEYNE